MLLFLPIMLFREAWTTSLRSVRRSLRYIIPMSTLLVVASAFAVAGVATLLGVPWEAALVLGAAVAPPDATAVAALGRLLPAKTFMKLKAESLTNDGTALVLYAIAVALLLGDQITPLQITGMVLLSYLGGAAAGIAVAAAAFFALRRMQSTLTINLTLALVPFVSFLIAELIDASGVLAVVFAGLIMAWVSPRITTAMSRRAADATWPFGVYLLNGALFVLIGLEVQLVLHEISGSEIGILLLVTVAAWIALFVVRYLFQWMFSPFSRPAAGSSRSLRHRSRIVSTVAGFRGPCRWPSPCRCRSRRLRATPWRAATRSCSSRRASSCSPCWCRDPCFRRSSGGRSCPNDDAAIEEYELAERAISGAALAALDDLAVEHGISDRVRDRARREGYERLELANARAVARQRAIEERDLAELDASLDDDSSATGPVPPDAPDTDRRSGDRAVAGDDVEGAAFTGPLQMIAVSEDIDVTQRSPCCVTRRRSVCGSRSSTASARCCSGCAARARSTTSSPARSSRVSISRRSAREASRRRATEPGLTTPHGRNPAAHRRTGRPPHRGASGGVGARRPPRAVRFSAARPRPAGPWMPSPPASRGRRRRARETPAPPAPPR